MNIKKNKQFGKVAVLLGGSSSEREISLKSGQAVFNALIRQGVDAVSIDVDDHILQSLQTEHYDCAFIVLHGAGGEDGVIQGALETIKLPYTGTGVMGSALAMDKIKTKQIWQSCNLPTPSYVVVQHKADLLDVPKKLNWPVIVKPVTGGSSIGMAKVESEVELMVAWENARQYDSVVLVEQWIVGKEYTISILDNNALPVIKLKTPNEFYDYEAKYASETTQYECPCGLTEDQEFAVKAIALQAFNVLDCKDWGRVDVMVDDYNKLWLLEVNTVPGMTDHSLVPMAAKADGMGFDELVLKILDLSVH